MKDHLVTLGIVAGILAALVVLGILTVITNGMVWAVLVVLAMLAGLYFLVLDGVRRERQRREVWASRRDVNEKINRYRNARFRQR